LVPLLAGLGIDDIAQSALDVTAEAVDATFFDKNAGTNWKVPSHQDVIMPAVVAPAGSPTFMRFGATYVDSPEQVLRSLVAIRIHFDDCSPENGALAVVPGSHHRRADATDLAALGPDAFVVCPCRAGDLLIMRPLLVHRSSPATQPNHRRVLHVVYRPKVS
jgi:ectoine hydroxylase-related dioxygenase (phytanoyl-CoA dioxygenase family)